MSNNPTFGRDNGPPPPGAAQPAGVPIIMPGQPMYYQQAPYAQPLVQPAPLGYHTVGAPVMNPAGIIGGRGPQTYPAVDPSMPAANMSNSTGGVGCEPGYNYFFPQEHTKIHVLKSGSTPPWQLPGGYTVPFHAAHVPVNTTLRELMKGFGAVNPIPSKNIIVECTVGGGGKWYKGVTLTGEDKDKLDKPIKTFGWDSSRTGLAGEKPVVSLYVMKG